MWYATLFFILVLQLYFSSYILIHRTFQLHLVISSIKQKHLFLMELQNWFFSFERKKPLGIT